MKKLTKKQDEKLRLIQAYINTEIGSSGLLIDCNCTYISFIRMMYIDCTGIVIKGYEYGLGDKIDRIEPEHITDIYNSGMKKDDDFKVFCTNLINYNKGLL